MQITDQVHELASNPTQSVVIKTNAAYEAVLNPEEPYLMTSTSPVYEAVSNLEEPYPITSTNLAYGAILNPKQTSVVTGANPAYGAVSNPAQSSVVTKTNPAYGTAPIQMQSLDDAAELTQEQHAGSLVPDLNADTENQYDYIAQNLTDTLQYDYVSSVI